MKRKLSVVLAALMSLGCLFGTTACGKKNSGAKKGTLKITYFEGGYGDDWLEYALENYKKKNEGFAYELDSNNSITGDILTYLQSGKNLSDIYILQEGSWTEWVTLGYLADLKDVYEAEVETSSGKQKIKDYMDQELVGRYYMQMLVGQGEYLPWVLPEASITTSIIYNEEYLLSTKHTTAREGKYAVGDIWTAPPETVSELLDYCADLNARGIVPFSWAGKESHWLRFFIYTWFAQYQGVHEVNELNAETIASEGSYYDFWNFANAEVWKMTGIQVGIDTLKSIFIDEKGNNKNSLPHVSVYGTQDAEKKLVAGESAMLVGGSFFYNEMTPFLDWKDDDDNDPDYTFKMMPLPTIESAERDENGNPKKLAFYSTDEIMIVPAGAKNLDMAKGFLASLFNEENNLYFTQKTGTMRPFNYDARALSGEAVEWSPFTESVLDIYNDIERIYAYPSGTPKEDVSLIYRYKEPDIVGSHSWATTFSAIRKYTGKEVMVTGKGTTFKSVYDATKKTFDDWYYELYE